MSSVGRRVDGAAAHADDEVDIVAELNSFCAPLRAPDDRSGEDEHGRDDTAAVTRGQQWVARLRRRRTQRRVEKLEGPTDRSAPPIVRQGNSGDPGDQSAVRRRIQSPEFMSLA